MVGDVFEEHDPRFSFANDAMDVRPKVPRIITSTASAGFAERLARVSSSERIHDSTPRPAVKGSHVRENRRFIQATRFHCLSQDFDDSGLVFHTTDCANASESELQSQVETCAASTKAEIEEGMLIHTVACERFREARWRCPPPPGSSAVGHKRRDWGREGENGLKRTDAPRG